MLEVRGCLQSVVLQESATGVMSCAVSCTAVSKRLLCDPRYLLILDHTGNHKEEALSPKLQTLKPG